MESKLVKKHWGLAYVSKNGIEYAVGEVTADFNVVVDEFGDINELFDYEAIVLSKPIDYVYGDLNEDADNIKKWLDERIDRYEKHERVVKFYTNLLSRTDTNTLYECYIGTEEKRRETTRKIERNRMMRIAEEVRGGK